LTGWKIDIKSETRAAEAQAELDDDEEGGLAEDKELVDGNVAGDDLVADEVSGDEAPLDSGVDDEEAKD